MSEYLGLVPFARALHRQNDLWAMAQAGQGTVLGFESEPTITLGKRSGREDVLQVPAGFAVQVVDRGGQATIHHPGQLVIFPVLSVRDIGARRWVECLGEATRRSLLDQGVNARFDACRPGLYTQKGKIGSIGVRLRGGVSTHGVSINVHNDLADFRWIRACGVAEAPMDQIGDGDLPDLFANWLKNFSEVLTSLANLPNLCSSQPYVRS